MAKKYDYTIAMELVKLSFFTLWVIYSFEWSGLIISVDSLKISLWAWFGLSVLYSLALIVINAKRRAKE